MSRRTQKSGGGQRLAHGIAGRIHKALIAAGLNQIEAARRASEWMPEGQKVTRDAIHKAVIRGSMPRDKKVRDAIARTLGVTAPMAVVW